MAYNTQGANAQVGLALKAACTAEAPTGLTLLNQNKMEFSTRSSSHAALRLFHVVLKASRQLSNE